MKHKKMVKKSKIEIAKLPSGFYAVFINNVFYNAALPNKDAADQGKEMYNNYLIGKKGSE